MARRLSRPGMIVAAGTTLALVAIPVLALLDGPAPGASDEPTEAFGRRVMTVAEALEVRDHRDPRPSGPVSIAVAGWYSASWAASCPASGPVDPLEARCPAMFGWLMESPEDQLTVTATSASGRQPIGPAFNPRFLPGVSAPEVPPGPVTGVFPDPAPVRVVLVGHWNDSRAAFCTDDGAVTCAREFVVEGTAWVDAEAIDPVAGAVLLASGGPPQGAAQLALDSNPGWTVASMTLVDAADWLSIDPRVAAVPGLRLAGAAWFVRLVSPKADEPTSTVMILDGEREVRALPGWPVRVAPAERLPPTTTTDAAGVTLRCVGVVADACGKAAALARRTDPDAFDRARAVIVVPASPAWTAWPDAAGVVLVATVRTGFDGSSEVHAYLARGVDGAEAIQPLPRDGSLPPHLDAAVVATEAGE